MHPLTRVVLKREVDGFVDEQLARCMHGQTSKSALAHSLAEELELHASDHPCCKHIFLHSSRHAQGHGCIVPYPANIQWVVQTRKFGGISGSLMLHHVASTV
jgi:hypothetical protein